MSRAKRQRGRKNMPPLDSSWTIQQKIVERDHNHLEVSWRLPFFYYLLIVAHPERFHERGKGVSIRISISTSKKPKR